MRAWFGGEGDGGDPARGALLRITFGGGLCLGTGPDRHARVQLELLVHLVLASRSSHRSEAQWFSVSRSTHMSVQKYAVGKIQLG